MKSVRKIFKLYFESKAPSYLRPLYDKNTRVWCGYSFVVTISFIIFAYTHYPLHQMVLQTQNSSGDYHHQVDPEVAGTSTATGIGGAEKQVFSKSIWYPSNPNAFLISKGILSLSPGYNAVRFETSGVPVGVRYPTIFTTYGRDAINLEVSRRDVYRIVFGDGDYKTLTFHYYDNLRNEFQLIEQTQQTKRPIIRNCSFKQGDNIISEVHERYSSLNQKLFVNVTISCDGKYDSFEVSFPAPANLFELQDVYYALLDYSNDSENQSSVYFVQPEIAGSFNSN